MGSYSNITKNKREQLKGAMDNFCTFEWCGIKSFDTYGAFIISDKRGDLKAYSGLKITNNYSKPQFESSAGQLQGITFNTKSIEFKIGVYWISMADYRKFLSWLSPYEVNDLTFSYNSDFAYFCKLSKLDDASKYIIGYEDGEPMYYFEMNIGFEIQGEACAHSVDSYSWIKSSETIDQEKYATFVTDKDYTWKGYTLNGVVNVSYPEYENNRWTIKTFDDSKSKLSSAIAKQSELDTSFNISLISNSINKNYSIVGNTNQLKLKYKCLKPSTDYKFKDELGNNENFSFSMSFMSNEKSYQGIKMINGDLYYIDSENYSTKVYDGYIKLWLNKTWQTISNTISSALTSSDETWFTNNFTNKLTNDNTQSIETPCNFSSWYFTNLSYIIKKIEADIGFVNESSFNKKQQLFTIVFKDNVEFSSNQKMFLNYNSQHGIVYWGANDVVIPLTYATIWNNKKCIESLNVESVLVPGSLTKEIDWKNLSIQISTDVEALKMDDLDNVGFEYTMQDSNPDNLNEYEKNALKYLFIQLCNDLGKPYYTNLIDDQGVITMYARQQII